jgi:alanyl-tRNA synthetase
VAVGSVAERLYYDGDAQAALEFRAVVTDVRLDSHAVGESGQKEQLWQVALDRTAFYPVGGGQPWDTGAGGDGEEWRGAGGAGRARGGG